MPEVPVAISNKVHIKGMASRAEGLQHLQLLLHMDCQAWLLGPHVHGGMLITGNAPPNALPAPKQPVRVQQNVQSNQKGCCPNAVCMHLQERLHQSNRGRNIMSRCPESVHKDV